MADVMNGFSVPARREEIARLASLSGLANVDQLAAKFSVTPSTIRRDLAHLVAEGRLARTYGGAISILAHAESSYRQRLGEAAEAKRSIARWAARQVQPGESILLDAGTTVGALARELRVIEGLTIATTGLSAVDELVDVPGVRLECLGGTLRSVSRSFVGPTAEAALERMTFDRVFLGADGVTVERGICEAALEQTRLKEIMARSAEHVYVLAHGAKVGRSAFHAWARLPAHWTLVTDETVPPSAVAPFNDAGITVVVVDAAGEQQEGRGRSAAQRRRPVRARPPAAISGAVRHPVAGER